MANLTDVLNFRSNLTGADIKSLYEAEPNAFTDTDKTNLTNNTSARHDAVTVVDSSEIDFTLTGQQITASIVEGSIDETKLDASVNASLNKANSALPSANYTAADVLSKLLTVDGSGSGIDADLLDGVHLSSLLRNSSITTQTGNSRLGFFGFVNSIDTGIDINQGATGGGLLIFHCRNFNDGDSTAIGLNVFRFCFNGDFAPTRSTITGEAIGFSVSATKTLILSGVGNISCFYVFIT